MSRKRKQRTSAQIVHLNEALLENGRAMQEGPKRKSWTRHDLKYVKPLTPSQTEMFHDFFNGQQICAHGSAGTGKSFVAIFLALNELFRNEDIDKIIIVRSAVPTRDMGFMPGTLEEKEMYYELPYQEMFADLLGRKSSYQDMKDAGVVKFCTTSYVRGVTWDNAVVVVDEGQNMTWQEINSVITRLGQSSRLIVVGDLLQTDLRKKHESTGMDQFIEVANKMRQFSVIRFTHHDIVRSEFVKSWIVACEESGITS